MRSTPNLGGSGGMPPRKILNFNLHVMQSGYNLVTFTNQSARQGRCTTFFLPKSRLGNTKIGGGCAGSTGTSANAAASFNFDIAMLPLHT